MLVYLALNRAAAALLKNSKITCTDFDKSNSLILYLQNVVVCVCG